jgi:hypothetical protein
MHAMGEIKESNRYQTQPDFTGGGFHVIDRVNGQQIGQSLPSSKAAALEADRLNAVGSKVGK